MTLPCVVILALLFGLLSGGTGSTSSSSSPAVLPALSLPAPPSSTATAGPCTALLSVLPTALGTLAPRVVHPTPDSLFVVAWGDPAVVLRCGVDRPAHLAPSSSALLVIIDGVAFLPVQARDSTVFTAIDRAAYVEVTVPKSYPQPPLAALADAIAKAMKPVCSTPDLPSTLPSCLTRR